MCGGGRAHNGSVRFATTEAVHVAAPPPEVWADVVDVAAYRRWWPWLRVDGPRRVLTGQTLSVSIPSPFGYRLRVELTPVEVAEARSVAMAVAGDLRGIGALTVTSAGPGASEVEITWDVEIVRPVLRVVGFLGRPLLEWGHRRVMARAVRGYLQHR